MKEPRKGDVMANVGDCMLGTKRNTKGAAATKSVSKTEKELSKLRRMDLLELLIGQIRENEQQAAELAELRDLSSRLKVKLDDKDAQIEHLKRRLDAKDDEIERLNEINRGMAHANGLLGVRELLDIERLAVEQYFRQLSSQANRSDYPRP